MYENVFLLSVLFPFPEKKKHSDVYRLKKLVHECAYNKQAR